jgi:hypothetical protein
MQYLSVSFSLHLTGLEVGDIPGSDLIIIFNDNTHTIFQLFWFSKETWQIIRQFFKLTT